MSIEDIKTYVILNKKPLVIGAVVALVIRAVIR
jgi:hypothetical protein